MKTIDKNNEQKKQVSKPAKQNSKEMQTDFPLSEKDEVKKAEKNLRESQKKNG